MANHLQGETSPYLLQHAENPVDWYPWREDAFEKARREDKPIFLSIGYSTCHWCHVMAHESFEDPEVAALLNEHFVSIKVDREERPDIDSIYLTVCQVFTGGGGWPASIFMTPDQKPFFAGTYFPKENRPGLMGMLHLLPILSAAWKMDRDKLLESADQITALLNGSRTAPDAEKPDLMFRAVEQWQASFDPTWGGFGSAPKFPMGHNLLFLLTYGEKARHPEAQSMAEKTLEQLYRGGIFDHIGGGFSRYSTDQKFAIPHFEKMLYDNALLLLAYCKAYSLTRRELYREVAVRTADYVLRELTLSTGAFISAQDADSKEGEGAYYAFRPEEIFLQLGKKRGEEFNAQYNITPAGNFYGKSIPNLLHGSLPQEDFTDCLSKLYTYRLARMELHRDAKLLTGWNGLMIAAMATLYRVTGDPIYRQAAEAAWAYLEKFHWKDGTLYASSAEGKLGKPGFLEDYAFSALGLLALYETTFQRTYLTQAQTLCRKVLADFADEEAGGFYLTARDSETLLIRPKEMADGALPSGNTAMAYVLVRLFHLTKDEEWKTQAQKQLDTLALHAGEMPTAYPVYLLARLEMDQDPEEVTIVLAADEGLPPFPWPFSLDAVVKVLEHPTEDFPLCGEQTTCYVCENHTCLPPKPMKEMW